MRKTRTNEDFNKLQESYSKGYFELYKKYFKEKEKIRKAIAKLDSMFANGNEEVVLDDLLELYEVLGGNNGQERNKEQINDIL